MEKPNINYQLFNKQRQELEFYLTKHETGEDQIIVLDYRLEPLLLENIHLKLKLT